MNKPGTLYIVATPIGNMQDITIRAISVLQSVGQIFAEDTRNTRNLLSYHSITTACHSYHQHSSSKIEQEIIDKLYSGIDIALVTDAGTPGVSDPGSVLVDRVRSEIGDIIRTIPGPSALTAALAIAGGLKMPVVFYGFIPQKKGRQKFLTNLEQNSAQTHVWYESTHRIMRLLKEMSEYSGLSTREVKIFRELTKMFEEVMVGTPHELLSIMESDNMHSKGEFVVML